jgi:hypothetical protein
VLDCGHLRFCDSGGLNAFITIRQLPEVGSVTVARPSATVRRLLAVTSLDMFFETTAPVPTPRLSAVAQGAPDDPIPAWSTANGMGLAHPLGRGSGRRGRWNTPREEWPMNGATEIAATAMPMDTRPDLAATRGPSGTG